MWGERLLHIPPWLATSWDAVERRLARLATTRQIHTVRVPLWQNTAAHSAAVAAIDAGDYIDLVMAYPDQGVNIDAIGLVLHRQLEWSPTSDPTLVFTVVEIGEAAPVPPLVPSTPRDPDRGRHRRHHQRQRHVPGDRPGRCVGLGRLAVPMEQQHQLPVHRLHDADHVFTLSRDDTLHPRNQDQVRDPVHRLVADHDGDRARLCGTRPRPPPRPPPSQPPASRTAFSGSTRYSPPRGTTVGTAGNRRIASPPPLLNQWLPSHSGGPHV